MKKNPKIGLALGGGLARGLAHIGAIRVLQEKGIKIDYIAGTSMGSLIAALYACGLKLKLIERLAQRISRRTWMDLTFPRMGLIAGDKLEELLYMLTGRRNFADLTLPLAVVAVDLISGERVVLTEGSVARAVRASCAIPGIFSPVEIGGKLLVDGGVLQRVPASVVREMGAELVIAVDVGIHVGDYKISHIFDVMSKSLDIMSREIHRRQSNDADVLIAPGVSDLGPFDFQCVEKAIDRGEEAAREVLPQLVKLKKEG
ncbi:MAG: patatin-like phospholipase family protein [Firmicutes bacterium]|nr:patatin-like phospholipase family protein [Bacillota bacterium]